jgi:UDP-glucose 6-dehydrogenase
MDILNSNWLIKMLEKSSQSPQMRMLNLFDILEDWLDAPNVLTPEMRKQLAHSQKPIQVPLLQDFLTRQAAKAGAAMPEMLANQLYFMVLAATQEKLQASNHAGFGHAKSAAKALILAQTKKEFHIAKSTVYATAASFFGVLLVAGSVFLFYANQSKSPTIAQAGMSNADVINNDLQTASTGAGLTANPSDTAALFAQIEQMRKGNCQLIEAIQLPDSYKKVYFENIVLGQISTDVKDQQLVRELLDKVRCNYSPMLMVNSK